MPQHRGTPVLHNVVLVTWTQGPWIAKYLECHCYRAWVRSEPARGRSASSYEAAIKKNNSTVYGQWSTLDRQEMNRDAHAWAECVGLCGSRKGNRKQSMVNGPWPMVHAEQLMVNG